MKLSSKNLYSYADARFENIYRWVAVVFIILCGLHFFSMRPLWLDEDFIYGNLTRYDGAEFFQVLYKSQAFPRIHLIIIDWFSGIFDHHVWALRLPSMLLMGGAFLIWYKLYARHSSSRLTAILALIAFTVAYKMSYYSAELKSYAADVFAVAWAAGIVTWQQRDNERNNPARYTVAALFPVTVLFSYGALFVFWIPAYNFCVRAIKEKRGYGLAALSVLSVTAFFLLSYFTDLRFSMNNNGLKTYWHSYFILTGSAADFFDTFGDGLKKIVTYWYGNSKYFIRAMVIGVPFFLMGLYRSLNRRDEAAAWSIQSLGRLGGVIFAEMVILGLFHKYPFTGERVTLFFAPFVFWMTVEGMDMVKRPKWLRWLFLGYFFVFCAICLLNTFWQFFKLYL